MGISTGPGALTSCHARDNFPFYRRCLPYQHCCYRFQLTLLFSSLRRHWFYAQREACLAEDVLLFDHITERQVS